MKTLKTLRDGLAMDLSEKQIAELLNTSTSTISRRKTEKRHRFDNALKRGRAKAIAAVTNALYTSALDGNTTAQIFFLKNRDSGSWMDKAEVNHNLNLAEILDTAKNRVIEGKVVTEQLDSQRVLSEDALPNKNTG
jgi:transcriptional regulator with XRE-family HTH domain